MRCSRNLRNLSDQEFELLLRFHSGELTDVQLGFLCSEKKIEKSLILESVRDLDEYLFSLRTLLFCFFALAIAALFVLFFNFFGG